MKPETSVVDAAIGHAARALVTPPPDDGLLSRVVARLPHRPARGRGTPWILAVAASALVAWLVIGPAREQTVVPGQRPSVLRAAAWRALAPLTSSVAPAVPRRRVPAVEPAPAGPVQDIGHDDEWGLPPVAPPVALVVGALPAAAEVEQPIDVPPIAVRALPAPAALIEMKE